MPRNDQRSAPAGPHHISAIAHLFFEDPAEDPEEAPAQPTRDVVVASPTAGVAPRSVAALVLAAAARHPAPRIQVVETAGSSESARAYLTSVGRVREHDDLTGGLVTMECGGAGDEVADRAPWMLRWRHCGVLTAEMLGIWETARRGPPLAVPTRQHWTGLVWCLPADLVLHLAPLAILGRLLRLTRPDRLEIVVVEPVAGTSPGPGIAAELDRLRDRVEALAADVPTLLTTVAEDHGESASSSPRHARIVERLCAGSPPSSAGT